MDIDWMRWVFLLSKNFLNFVIVSDTCSLIISFVAEIIFV